MAAKSDTLEFALLQFIFNAVATNFPLGATAGSTSLWLGLFTADPTAAGSTSNEGGYAAYTRAQTDRSSAASTGWAVTSGASTAAAVASPVATVSFPQNTATSTGTFTYAGVYTSSNVSSSGMLYYGTLTPNVNFSQNVTPQVTTGSSISES